MLYEYACIYESTITSLILGIIVFSRTLSNCRATSDYSHNVVTKTVSMPPEKRNPPNSFLATPLVITALIIIIITIIIIISSSRHTTEA